MLSLLYTSVHGILSHSAAASAPEETDNVVCVIHHTCNAINSPSRFTGSVNLSYCLQLGGRQLFAGCSSRRNQHCLSSMNEESAWWL